MTKKELAMRLAIRAMPGRKAPKNHFHSERNEGKAVGGVAVRMSSFAVHGPASVKPSDATLRGRFSIKKIGIAAVQNTTGQKISAGAKSLRDTVKTVSREKRAEMRDKEEIKKLTRLLAQHDAEIEKMYGKIDKKSAVRESILAKLSALTGEGEQPIEGEEKPDDGIMMQALIDQISQGGGQQGAPQMPQEGEMPLEGMM